MVRAFFLCGRHDLLAAAKGPRSLSLALDPQIINAESDNSEQLQVGLNYSAAANMRMQPDAASRPQDRGDFGSSFRYNAIALYRCGAADARGVGWRLINAMSGYKAMIHTSTSTLVTLKFGIRG